MEILQQFSPLFPSFSHLPLNLLLSILQFLDYDSKMQIKNYTSKNQNSKEFFIQLLSMSLFIDKYLNATDRSVYFPIYADQAYRKYEKQIISQLCVHNIENYLKLQLQVESIFQLIRHQLSSFNSKNELVQTLEAIIRDPFIPLPKMRKEGIAMHCNSSLQYALVDLYFQPGQEQGMFLQQWAIQLEQFLLQNTCEIQARLGQQLKERRRRKSLIKIMKQAYYHPQLINTENYHDYLILQITPYNLFIYVHALVSGIAQIYNLYILDQGKHFEKFIEYQLRYSIFRSIILNIEQSYLSKILYQRVESIIQKAVELSLKNSQLNCAESKRDFVIFQVGVELENKKSGEEQLENLDLLIPNSLSRVSSEVKTQKTQRSDDLYQQINFQMRSRLYLAGGKIWANQSRRVKQNYDQYNSPQKQNNYCVISQQSVNNRSYIKILNRLLQSFLIEKVQQQIKSRSSLKPIRQIAQANVRDQDIINIFGNSNSEQQISSPTFSYSSYHSNFSNQSPKSPHKTYCFTKMVDRLEDLQKNSIQFAIYRALQNAIQLRPYKYQTNIIEEQNEKFNNSPEKKEASQCYLQNLDKKTPKNNKLLSKTSMLSKFSKITETRLMSSVEELFIMNEGNQQQILLQYHSHLIDLSVNQFNVHWCGHSTQPLMGQYYEHFEEGVIRYCEGLMFYILKMVEDISKKGHQYHNNLKDSGQNMQVKLNIIKRTYEWLLQYLDRGYIAKKTLKKLCCLANTIIQNQRNKHKIESQYKQIELQLEQVDKMIEYYNEKMWKIDRNPPQEILKIYEQRKSPRNFIQVLKCAQTENQEQRFRGKKDKKRRNSEQAMVVHNID